MNNAHPQQVGQALQQAQMAEQVAAIKQKQVNQFMLDTISRVYAGLIVKYGAEVPVEQLANQAKEAAEHIGVYLGIINLPETAGEKETAGKVVAP